MLLNNDANPLGETYQELARAADTVYRDLIEVPETEFPLLDLVTE